MQLPLIKNNLKLMFRSKWILLMIAFLPILTIAMLSNAFKDLLNVNYQIEEFSVGYRISEDSFFLNYLDNFKSVCEDNSIHLVEYPEGEIKELVTLNTVTAFIDFNNIKCSLYQSDNDVAESTIIQSILSSFISSYNQNAVIATYIAQNTITIPISTSDDSANYLVTEDLEVNPVPPSIDYYGIVEVVYFMWCAMVSLAAVITSERKNRIQGRLRIAPISKLSLYIGKWLPCTIAIILEVGFAIIVSILFLDVHWGNWLGSIGILFLVASASSAFGILLFYIFNSLSLSIIVGWILIFVAGFLGGSFQTYMYCNFSEKQMLYSPFYRINRTLVEFSTKGESAYTKGCVIMLLSITIVCICLGILIMNKKMEEE